MNNNKEDVKHNTTASDEIENLFNSSEFNIKQEEYRNILNKVSIVAKEFSGWSESTAQLFFMETLRNFSASYKILFCQILFIPLFIIFILSLCVFFGIVGYSFYNNLIIASAIFLTSLFMVLVFLTYWQKRLSSFLGFSDTISQLKEGADAIIKAAK